MSTVRRLVFTAVIAGLVSGGLISLAHAFGTAAIIARAEVFEKAGEAPAHVHSHGPAETAPHTHDAAPAADWEPQDGIERTTYTVLANMVTGVAFSLLLVAAFELRGGATWRTGLFWGLAGFAAFTLAPGLGLPPELPGTAAAPLAARQLWWAMTAAATAGGLALLLLQPRPAWMAAGVVLLAAPHLIGAPQPAEYASTAPESLAHQFRVVATLTSLLFWLVLGTSTGWVFGWMKRSPALPVLPEGASQRS